MPAFPGIGKTFVRLHLQHLAVNGAVPRAGRRGLVGEVFAFPGSKPAGIISQRPIKLAVFSVFQIVSCVCGKTSSTTMCCVSGFNAVSFMDQSPSAVF